METIYLIVVLLTPIALPVAAVIIAILTFRHLRHDAKARCDRDG